MSAQVQYARGGGSLFGVVAEYPTPGALLHAVEKVRAAGFSKVDTHTPFPVHGMDRAMGLPQSKLPFITFGFGITGTASAVLMQWWMNAYDYPLAVGGKPYFSYQAYVPVMFELTVLLAAISTVLGLFALCRLPQPYHPLFTHERFLRATDDAFILSIEATDPRWDEDKVQKVLEETGGQEITLIHDVAESLDA